MLAAVRTDQWTLKEGLLCGLGLLVQPLLILKMPCSQGNWGHRVCELPMANCDFLPCHLQNEKKSVKMMTQKDKLRIGFIEELQAQILEMRYTMGKVSMFVLLPPSSADNVKSLQEVSLHFTSVRSPTVDPWRIARLSS